MPKDVETAAVETETGFGTGLLEHLKSRRQKSEAATDHSDPASEPAQGEPAEPELTEQEEALLELERELIARGEAILAREAELAAKLEQVEAELARARAEVEPQAEAVADPAPPPEPVVSARDYLRDRVESEAERVWGAFSSALEATKGNGAPDFRTRLLAATALLAEAYGERERPAALAETPSAAELHDELAVLRARRANKPR
jgi:hypothetical protein